MTEQAGAESLRTYEEINAKIKRGDAVVVTADEFISHVAENGLEASAKEVPTWVRLLEQIAREAASSTRKKVKRTSSRDRVGGSSRLRRP